jgi:hypothetical protein
MGGELFTSWLHASRFTPLVRFRQSYEPGIHAHNPAKEGMLLAEERHPTSRCEGVGSRLGGTGRIFLRADRRGSRGTGAAVTHPLRPLL